MTSNDKMILNELNEVVLQLISGQRVTVKYKWDIVSDNPEIQNLQQNIQALSDQYNENYNFIIDLSKGKLNTSPPPKNSFANPYKQLHADLLHLTWQIKEISQGDYEQKVSFSGDFAEAINKMIIILKEKKLLDELNWEKEHLFRLMFELSPDGILVADIKGYIQFISASGKRMFGLTDEDVRSGLNLFDFVHEEDKERAISNNIERLKGNYEGFSEYRVIKKDGTIFWNETNAAFIFDPLGNPKSLFVVFRDITERKVAEERIKMLLDELTQSKLEIENNLKQKETLYDNLVISELKLKELLAAKDKFFSIIAHDLKNPFFGLLGINEILINNIKNDNKKRALEFATAIHDASERGYKLLVNLLDWSRSQTGRIDIEIESLDINNILDENIALIKANAIKKNINIVYDKLETLEVKADLNLLNTIIRNLLNNAIKYSNESGTIKITATKQELFALISIEDNGVGIKDEDIEKLFRYDVSYSLPGTWDEKGTGLGLILCKDFINKMGGDIGVKSQYGKGSMFTISLPIAS